MKSPVSWSRMLADGRAVIVALDEATDMVSVAIAGCAPIALSARDACTLGLGLQEAARIAAVRRIARVARTRRGAR